MGEANSDLGKKRKLLWEHRLSGEVIAAASSLEAGRRAKETISKAGSWDPIDPMEAAKKRFYYHPELERYRHVFLGSAPPPNDERLVWLATADLHVLRSRGEDELNDLNAQLIEHIHEIESDARNIAGDDRVRRIILAHADSAKRLVAEGDIAGALEIAGEMRVYREKLIGDLVLAGRSRAAGQRGGRHPKKACAIYQSLLNQGPAILRLTANQLFDAYPESYDHMETGDFEIYRDEDQISQTHVATGSTRKIKRKTFGRYVKEAREELRRTPSDQADA